MKISLANTGNKFSEDICRARSEQMLKAYSSGKRKPHDKSGWCHSEESKKVQSELAKLRPKLECPHCQKLSDPGNSKRFHFDNCKTLLTSVLI